MKTILLSIARLYREPRQLLLLSALYCAALLLFAMVLAATANLVPCPLCIVQRFFYGFVGLTAAAGYVRWWSFFTERVAGGFVVAFSFSGFLVALRHVFLQTFPNRESSGCAVSFGSFLDDAILALGGTGNCSLVDWSFLTLSIPEWSLIAFTLLLGVGARVLWLTRRLPNEKN